MSSVIVHKFMIYKPEQDEMVLAKGWGTMEIIEKWSGQVIPNTAREVDIAKLTATGRYHETA
jgi:hypothetical protein